MSGVTDEAADESAIIPFRKKRGRGRPTLLTPEVIWKIKSELENGCDLGTAARCAGLRPRVVFDWVSRGQGKQPWRRLAPEYVEFAEMIEFAQAAHRSKLIAGLSRMALTDANVAFKMLALADPDRWTPRRMADNAESEEDRLGRFSPAIAQTPEDEAVPDEIGDGSVTLRERTILIPAGRIEEFARTLRGQKGSAKDEFAVFHESADDVPRT